MKKLPLISLVSFFILIPTITLAKEKMDMNIMKRRKLLLTITISFWNHLMFPH